MLSTHRKSIDVFSKTCALVVCLFAFGRVTASAATTFSNISANTASPAQFDKYEIDFDLSGAYVNPFDPEEVDVKASFLTPTGQTEVVPGFYNKGSSPKWAVRYAPRLTGSYSVTIMVTDAGGVGQSSAYTFSATAPGANRGFLGVSGTRFIDSAGKQLTLIGTNYAWGDPDQFLASLPAFQNAKMNALRVWFSVWWGNYAPEWGPITTTQGGITMAYDGVGKYQLQNMARMDALMDGAAAHNIYVVLTMNSFGDFFYDWAQDAYNTANGGPTTYSDNNAGFWTNPIALGYQKKLLRYMFARWGYSRGFGMLEYWNESDNHVDTDATTRGNWHAAMDSTWKSWDFYQRPTTSSFAWKDHAEAGQTSWTALPTLSATTIHNYGAQSTIVDYLETNVKYMLSNYGARPAFVAEFGTTGNESSSDPGISNYIHDIIWAPMFRAGAAGASMYWSSSDFGFALSPAQKALYTALANFVQPEELDLPSMPFIDYGAQPNSTKIGGFKKADRALLWINHTTATWNVASPSTISGMSFTIPAFTNGVYNITFFDTTAGTTISTTTATASGGNLVISGIPSFTRDIAVKAIPAGSGDTTPPPVIIDPSALPSRLVNLSVRSGAGSGDKTLIMGFVISAGDSTTVLVRGLGPLLDQFGVTGWLVDPQLILFSGSALIDSNDNWPATLTSTFATVGAVALTPGSKDAALLRSMAQGVYSVKVTSADSTTGVALAEIYDVSKIGARLLNVSARSSVGTGGDILIAGFVIEGGAAKKLLIRGVGPTLAGYGVNGTLADPELTVFDRKGVLASNDNWGGTAELKTISTQVGAFALASDMSKDAELLITLLPGAYTVQVAGKAGTTGVALVEVYEVP